MNESNGEPLGLVASRTRWLVVAAALFATAAGFTLGGLLLLPLASFMILGAVVQPRSPRSGRWLMWTSASLLTLHFLPASVVLLSGIFRTPPPIVTLSGTPRNPVPYVDLVALGIISLWLVSSLLVMWCDAELVIDAWKLRAAPREVERGFLGIADWFLCLVATGLSLWWFPACVRAVPLYRRYGGLNTLLLTLAASAIIALLDVALVIDVVKTRHARQSGTKPTFK